MDEQPMPGSLFTAQCSPHPYSALHLAHHTFVQMVAGTKLVFILDCIELWNLVTVSTSCDLWISRSSAQICFVRQWISACMDLSNSTIMSSPIILVCANICFYFNISLRLSAALFIWIFPASWLCFTTVEVETFGVDSLTTDFDSSRMADVKGSQDLWISSGTSLGECTHSSSVSASLLDDFSGVTARKSAKAIDAQDSRISTVCGIRTGVSVFPFRLFVQALSPNRISAAKMIFINNVRQNARKANISTCRDTL